MMLDAHQHFWHYDPCQHAWMDDSMKMLRRDFLPADLQPELDAHGVMGCIAVQAGHSEAETHFLLQLAAQHDFIKAVVGWVDLRADNIHQRLEYFSQFKKLVGFRHIVQVEKDPAFLSGKNFGRGIAALEQYGFTYDILVSTHQLPTVLEFVRRFPRQPFVIDHLAKPPVEERRLGDWAVWLRKIAKQENVHCKVSGLVTQADWKNWKFDDFVPCLDVAAEAFGTERLLFGSDWPMCLLAASYGQSMSIALRYFGQFSTPEKATSTLEKVMGDNAARFYLRNF